MVANQSSDPIYSVPYEENSSTEPDGISWGLKATSVPEQSVPDPFTPVPSSAATFPSTFETFSGQNESNLSFRKDFNKCS